MTHTLRSIGVAVVTIGLLIGAARPAHAALILTMEEGAGDVVVSGSGTANLTGLLISLALPQGAGVDATDGSIVLGANPLTILPINFYTLLNGPTTFGPGGFVFASGGTGDRFGVFSSGGPISLVVPIGYVSGNSLTATNVFSSATFASLGVTPGTYQWTWGSGPSADSLTLQIGPTAVPEPVSLSLLAVGAAGVAVRRWRRRAA
jgi:hypothetical protein